LPHEVWGRKVMFRVLTKSLAYAAFLLGCSCAAQAGSAAVTLQATYAAVGTQTTVPYGWIDFCQRYKGECDTGATAPMDINLSPKAQAEIERINKWVNAAVEPVSDMDHWGVADQWDYPSDGKGDCEDYALMKRRMLIALGFPRQALLMTVVKDEHNDGHAILTVKTNRGEFVLDNLNAEIKPWSDTGYRFIKRQSQNDENIWVQVGVPATPLVASR
jgi:predicted transglutaminase-like cysteine proteinase